MHIEGDTKRLAFCVKFVQTSVVIRTTANANNTVGWYSPPWTGWAAELGMR